jgi:PPIC-type PPIASE domain
MAIRARLATILLATATALPLFGQQGATPPATPQGKPLPAPPKSGAQDPEKVAIPVPVETLATKVQQLETEKARLEQELTFVKEQAKSSILQGLRNKFSNRKLEVETIDAGIAKIMAPPPQPTNVPAPLTQMKRARLMTEDEKKALGDDVLLTISGQPVKKADIDGYMDYLRTFPSGDDNIRMQRTIWEVIRIEATKAAFPESAKQVEERLAALRERVVKGESMIAAAKEEKSELGEKPIEIGRNSPQGLAIERMAFATKEGETSPVFQTPNGCCILQVKEVVKGQSPALDKVGALVLQLPLHDMENLRKVQSAAVTGGVDITARDAATIGMLPGIYRPIQPANDPADGIKDKTPDAAPVKKANAETSDKQKAPPQTGNGGKQG